MGTQSNREPSCGVNSIFDIRRRSPEDWCVLYARYNNGCYANQWMVLDSAYFEPGVGLKRGGFWLLEQLPGYVRKEDLTETLNSRGYFASYNIAYFEDVYQLGGTWKLREKWGDDYSYEKCPRARIFRRGIPAVQDLSSMRAILRYNDFRHDPLARCPGVPGYTGSYAIGCRNDLNLKNGTYPREGLGLRNHAATDGKITSVGLLRAAASQVIAGPPYKHVGVFAWATSEFEGVPHWGLPERYEFPWVEVDGEGEVTVVGLEYADWNVC